ncbi:MAG: hypothetical protein C0467_29275 [Planctomycetaceae bacterium]|nr:hypothetical protein [Planctomycetaceae bacterium]
MVRLDEDDLRERQRRIDATIARASACHMSDAKWRKLFLALGTLGVGRIAWRFVRSDQLTYQQPPPESALMDSCLGDFGHAVGVPYREIDWVEIPAERAAGVAEGLAAVGEFPVRQVASGLRIVGYSWQPPHAEPSAAPDGDEVS